MAIGRVTSGQLYTNSQQSLAQIKSRLSVLQQQASDGHAITKPSDDPGGTAQVLRLRGDITATAQYKANIGDGLSWLRTIDSALGASENLIRKASDTVIQAANGTSSAETRKAAATQLEGIRADLLGQANTKYLGRSVFAGTSDAAQAFATSGVYSGAVTAPNTGVVERRISATETVPVSVDGAAAFGTVGTGGAQGTSVFETIDRIVAALKDPAYGTTAQDTVRAGIDDLKGALDRASGQRAIAGTNYSRIDTASTRNLDVATDLEQQRSRIEDVDAASVILDLKTQELAYQTAMAVTARVLQPTLMSFLQ